MQRRITIIAVTGLILFGGYGLVHLILTRNNGHLTLTLVPSDATYSIDGAGTYHGVKRSLVAGTHTLVFNRTGFASITTVLQITAGKTTTQTVILRANSDVGRQYLTAHPDEAAIAEGTAYNAGNAKGDAELKQYPIIDDLPYIGPGNEYRIDYGIDTSNNVAITITVTAQSDESDALGWIQSEGFNPSKLPITYVVGPVNQ